MLLVIAPAVPLVAALPTINGAVPLIVMLIAPLPLLPAVEILEFILLMSSKVPIARKD
jgi:hypothetical protein